MLRIFLFPLYFLFFCHQTQAQCWNLVWADEFNGNSLDLTKWSYQTGGAGWGNNELQNYTDRFDNTQVSAGTLKIIAKSESFGGNDYTSARIRTINKADFKYGRIEMYAKLPETQGIWPAFWMMPSENVFGAWPAGGEIDIMEVLGHQPNITYGTIHTANPSGGVLSSTSTYTLPSGSFASGFHTFAIEWEPTAIRWYIDNTLFATKTPAQLAPWRFTEFFHIILNVAVGGNWPGVPNATTVFPQQMEVDYVRVYQKNENLTITGKKKVEPGETVTYTLPTLSGATYAWVVPAGATLINGQGTPQVNVIFGAQSGNLSCAVTTLCGPISVLKPIEVTPNMLTNPSFEDNFMFWLNNNHNGSGAFSSFAISSIGAQNLTKKGCVTVNQIPTNTWDIQMAQTGLNLINGQSYTLKFWAQSDAPNRTISAAVINSSAFNAYKFQVFTIGQVWQEYTFTYIQSATAACQLNFDFGLSTGTHCIDNISFGKTALVPLAVDLIDFSAKSLQNKAVLMTWRIGQAHEVSQYEVERSDEGATFTSIHQQEANITSNSSYTYIDTKPLSGTSFYRLKIMDHNGKITYSQVISMEITTNATFSVYPNPSNGMFYLIRDEAINDVQIIRVHNQLGDLVAEQTMDSNRFLIDLSSYPSGVYMVHVGAEHIRLVLE
jgi:beta-glucanase (GH16 family)